MSGFRQGAREMANRRANGARVAQYHQIKERLRRFQRLMFNYCATYDDSEENDDEDGDNDPL